jgi:hypothetical protein
MEDADAIYVARWTSLDGSTSAWLVGRQTTAWVSITPELKQVTPAMDRSDEDPSPSVAIAAVGSGREHRMYVACGSTYGVPERPVVEPDGWTFAEGSVLQSGGCYAIGATISSVPKVVRMRYRNRLWDVPVNLAGPASAISSAVFEDAMRR